jgi:hypothetical protein
VTRLGSFCRIGVPTPTSHILASQIGLVLAKSPLACTKCTLAPLSNAEGAAHTSVRREAPYESPMATTTVSSWSGPGGGKAADGTKVSPSNYMLLGLGLATWMEFYTYDGVNLVLPDMAGTLGLSQDEASWILTTYLSALLFGVPLSIWAAGHFGHLRLHHRERGRLRRRLCRLCGSPGLRDAALVARRSGLRRGPD